MSPFSKPVTILEFHAGLTQITVGMREVAAKRKHWRQAGKKNKGGEFLGKHMIPVILGPK